MSYYDALIAKLATLSGTDAEKIAAVNALTVPGPRVNVAVSSVVGQMILSGVYLKLATFAKSAPTGDPTHDTALAYAATFMALVTSPNAPEFATANPTSYAIIQGMMDAILAQETASPGSIGFTQAVHDGLLGLSATAVPWWQASVAHGGGGLNGSVSQNDLDSIADIAAALEAAQAQLALTRPIWRPCNRRRRRIQSRLPQPTPISPASPR